LTIITLEEEEGDAPDKYTIRGEGRKKKKGELSCGKRYRNEGGRGKEESIQSCREKDVEAPIIFRLQIGERDGANSLLHQSEKEGTS